MTTPADIDAIRERADAALQTDERRQSALERWAEMPDRYAEDKLDRLIDEAAAWVNPLTADIATLLAHVDAQAERVRTLEAALGLAVDGLASIANGSSTERPPAENPHQFVLWLTRDLAQRRLEQAADALAANADAGNGGA